MKKLLLICALALGLAACGNDQPAVNPDGSPAPQQSSGGFWNTFGGAFAGSMLGNMLSTPRHAAPAYAPSAPTTVVNRTTIIKQKVYEAPKPAAKVPNLVQRPRASLRTFNPPNPSRSFSSGRR